MKLVKTAVLAAVFVTSAHAGLFGPDEHPYAMPARPAVVVPQAPSWFVKLPQDTYEMVFAVGTGTSSDEQMAFEKARLSAERRLVERTNSIVRTQTKSYRSDQGDVSVENFEIVTRKNANGELIGAQRVDSQVTFDGRVYKVYVLLRLPLGDANPAAQERRAKQLQRETEVRSRDAHEELNRNGDIDNGVKATPVPTGQVNSATVPTSEGEVKLMQVDNEEYKRRRDEALAKPGAVIGQSTNH